MVIATSVKARAQGATLHAASGWLIAGRAGGVTVGGCAQAPSGAALSGLAKIMGSEKKRASLWVPGALV
jgi:hypothetical protein